METFATLNPAFHRVVRNQAIGLEGYIVIDRFLSGSGTGGIRMAESLTLEEVANLAHEMTLKFSFLNIKSGGAKAGIVMPPLLPQEKKLLLCQEFGKAIGDLLKEGKYVAGEDLGINAQELSVILSSAGVMAIHSKNGALMSSEYFTALTVFLTAQEMLKANNAGVSGASVIIEGFGKVGEQAARLFSECHAKIVGVSTVQGALFDERGLDIVKIISLKKEHGDSFVHFYNDGNKIEKEKLIIQKADILIPGARPDSIDIRNIDKIQAKIIVPIANIAATEEIERVLSEKEIAYMPGFVANCGGILGYFIANQGFRSEAVEEIIKEGFPRKIEKLIAQAKNENKSLSQKAREAASLNFEKMAYEDKVPVTKLFSMRRLLYIAYKLALKANAGSLLVPFAKRYIEEKLFN